LHNYLLHCNESLESLTIENCPQIDQLILTDVLLVLKKAGYFLPKLKEVVFRK
jgi:hypothetical protein